MLLADENIIVLCICHRSLRAGMAGLRVCLCLRIAQVARRLAIDV